MYWHNIKRPFSGPLTFFRRKTYQIFFRSLSLSLSLSSSLSSIITIRPYIHSRCHVPLHKKKKNTKEKKKTKTKKICRCRGQLLPHTPTHTFFSCRIQLPLPVVSSVTHKILQQNLRERKTKYLYVAQPWPNYFACTLYDYAGVTYNH